MNLIKPSFEIWEQDISGNPDGIITSPETIASALVRDMYKHIERCGRTCYKSEDKITDTSADPFVNRMIQSQHYAMLEHGTVYLTISHAEVGSMADEEFKAFTAVLNSPYTKVNDLYENSIHITTNYRVLIENHAEILLSYFTTLIDNHEKRITVHFICDNGVAREFCRHRVFSFAQESTRYCNYSKDKFCNELTFIKPIWIDDPNTTETSYGCLISLLQETERQYMNLINNGWKPEQARCVLPLSLKTELIMTGFVNDWKHFFNLRALGTTGRPHPQAEELATPLMNEFKRLNYI